VSRIDKSSSFYCYEENANEISCRYVELR